MSFAINDSFETQVALPVDGRSVVATLAARDAIALTVRFLGMETVVQATGIKYRLVGGTANANWVALTDQSGATTTDSIVNALVFG